MRRPAPRPPWARLSRTDTAPATGTALWAALLAAGLLAGCGGPPASASYFPLEPGHRWVYALHSSWENNSVDDEVVTLSTEGEEDLPFGGRGWRRHSDSGLDYWLRHDDTGTYRVASKTDNMAEPEADKPVRYVLKMPLAVGTSWQASTTSYLLKRNAEFPPEIRHTHKPVLMTYQIAAVDQKLSTPAGDFSGCIKVQGQAVMKLFADPVVGFQDMPLTTTEWYCKGVGLVRVARSEPAGRSAFLQGGQMVMELTEWQ